MGELPDETLEVTVLWLGKNVQVFLDILSLKKGIFEFVHISPLFLSNFGVGTNTVLNLNMKVILMHVSSLLDYLYYVIKYNAYLYGLKMKVNILIHC